MTARRCHLTTAESSHFGRTGAVTAAEPRARGDEPDASRRVTLRVAALGLREVAFWRRGVSRSHGKCDLSHLGPVQALDEQHPADAGPSGGGAVGLVLTARPTTGDLHDVWSAARGRGEASAAAARLTVNGRERLVGPSGCGQLTDRADFNQVTIVTRVRRRPSATGGELAAGRVRHPRPARVDAACTSTPVVSRRLRLSSSEVGRPTLYASRSRSSQRIRR